MDKKKYLTHEHKNNITEESKWWMEQYQVSLANGNGRDFFMCSVLYLFP